MTSSAVVPGSPPSPAIASSSPCDQPALEIHSNAAQREQGDTSPPRRQRTFEALLNIDSTRARYAYGRLIATHAIGSEGHYMRPNTEARHDEHAEATVVTPNAGGLVDAPACGHPVLAPLGDPVHGYWCETCGSPFAPFEVVRARA